MDPEAQVIRGAKALAEPLGASVVTLGTFDGVHLGHQALLIRAIEEAKKTGALSVAYTFDPHPAKVLAPHAAPPVLVPTRERVRLLAESGVQMIVLEPFDADFAHVGADEWVERYLFERLQPRHVVVGFNFSYGRARGGNPDHLEHMGERLGFTVEVVPAIAFEGEVVSSTRIRALIAAGDVESAAKLLGRPFGMIGTIVRGDGRGRTIGVPTANLDHEGEVVPHTGVYATRVVRADGRRYGAVTNIGTRPTFSGHGRSIESHLLGFEGDLYGEHVRVEVLARLRDEKKFDGPEALVRQIHEDIDAARRRLTQLKWADIPEE